MNVDRYRPSPEQAAVILRRVHARRRARALATGGGVASLLVVAVAILATSPGPVDRVDFVGPHPTTSSPARPGTGASPTARAITRPQPARETPSQRPSPAATAGEPRESEAASPSTSPRPAYGSVRARESTSVARTCSTAASPGGVEVGTFCVTLDAGEPEDQPAFVLSACVATTAGGSHRLTFPDSLDADVVVTSTDGEQVWRWPSAGTSPGRPHTHDLRGGDCLEWEITWQARLPDGTKARPGSYLIEAWPRAHELAGEEPVSEWFDVD